jgi:hypothetical protein
MRKGSGYDFDKEENIITGLCANKQCQKRYYVPSVRTPVIEATDYEVHVEGSFMAHSQQFCSYECRHIWMKGNP